ncbi:LIS1 motif [Trinorchestia longiramus]|nr:LIS1 motif [Trinorchestia longiramus]
MDSENMDNFTYLLPSELARLVLGYLESRDCKQTAEKLLEELPELTEICELRKQGCKVQSKVWQLSLREALLDYAYSRELIRRVAVGHPSILGHLLESCLLSEQLRCLVSAITASRTMTKVCSQLRKRKLSSFGEKLLNKKTKLKEVSSCPTTALNAETPLDVVGDDQPLLSDVSSPLPKTPSKERSSPKRKDFRVRRRSPSGQITTLQEYHEQLTTSILSNTAFHEYFAAAINKTLADQGYTVVEDEAAQDTGTRSTDTNSGHAGCLTTDQSQVTVEPNVAETSGARGKVEGASSSAFTSNIAETVSKMIMDDPNYQDFFFFGINNENSNSRDAASLHPSGMPLSNPSQSGPCYEARSPSGAEVEVPNSSRLLTTPEPPCNYTGVGNLTHNPPDLCSDHGRGETDERVLGVNGSLLSGVNGSLLPSVNGSLLPGVNGSLLPGVNGSLLPGVNGSLLPGVNGSLLRGVNGSLLPGVNGSLLPGVNESLAH